MRLEAAFAALPLALGDRLALLAGRWFIESTTFFQVASGWCVVMSIVVLPVALVSGLQFPLLVALLGEGRAAVSRQLGTAYAWNTVGAIAGSLVGGFGAMPLLDGARHLAGGGAGVGGAGGDLGRAIVARRRGGRRWWSRRCCCLRSPAFFNTGPTAVWRHSGIGAGRACSCRPPTK